MVNWDSNGPPAAESWSTTSSLPRGPFAYARPPTRTIIRSVNPATPTERRPVHHHALKRIAAESDLVIVVGSKNSSNSVRLVEVCLDAGVKDAHLVNNVCEIDETWLEAPARLEQPAARRCRRVRSRATWKLVGEAPIRRRLRRLPSTIHGREMCGRPSMLPSYKPIAVVAGANDQQRDPRGAMWVPCSAPTSRVLGFRERTTLPTRAARWLRSRQLPGPDRFPAASPSPRNGRCGGCR